MKLSIFTTGKLPQRRGDLFAEPLTNYHELADEVVYVEGNTYIKEDRDRARDRYDKLGIKFVNHAWRKEFKWSFIGQQFQRGYEACTGDWVLHLDLDMIIHEKDFETLRAALRTYDTNPGLRFWKYQFFTTDRYNIKSHLVLAVNKRLYGDRIRFDGGGDLCQPTLDGEYIQPLKAPEIKVPIWNYDCILKTKKQIMEDKGRFARAWQREFGTYKLGGPDDESAYNKWWEMVQGRYVNHKETIAPDHHPKVMQETIKNLTPEQFGFNGFGLRT